ncbi:MAG: DUF2752 domain-containing protein, partial [Lachnospiraceae bacterium]|nr:DUF2752 domain-containing protein [Lachnospiraceae bacterium]
RIHPVVAFACVILAALIISGVYRCPFRLIFSFPCPFCGIIRASTCVIHGDFKTAFHFHPLWPLITAGVLIYIPYRLGIIKIPDRIFNAGAAVIGALILICYVIRIMTGTLV